MPNSSRLNGRSAAAWRVTLIDCARSQGSRTGVAAATALSRLRLDGFPFWPVPLRSTCCDVAMFFTRERVVCAYYFIGRPQHVQQDEQC